MHTAHRYWKSLTRLLKVCYVPATIAALKDLFSSFFAVAINSINEANKEAGMRHYTVYLLRCLWYSQLILVIVLYKPS